MVHTCFFARLVARFSLLCAVVLGGGLAWRFASAAASTPAQEGGQHHPSLSAPRAGPPTRRAEPPTASPTRQWVSVPRVWGRLKPAQVGLVINTADPYSVAVGEYYASVRGLQADQILRLSLPVKPELTPAEFETFMQRVNAAFGERIQALALAWTQPYAVGCNSITGALAMGFDARLCQQPCGPSRPSPYFNSAASYPYTELGMRLSMLLAARDIAGARAMIDRGVVADGSLASRAEPLPRVHFVSTSDAIRSQRDILFPPGGPARGLGVEVRLDRTDALRDADRVLMYLTGRVQVDALDRVTFLPGALADHLTSFGGRLTEPLGQMSALAWIDAGATASYGTVSEPCAHLQKFPHPQVLLLHYAQGSTAIEAYWKSVAWPQQGVMLGEPLAAPFASQPVEEGTSP